MTGVQTCALPISCAYWRRARAAGAGDGIAEAARQDADRNRRGCDLPLRAAPAGDGREGGETADRKSVVWRRSVSVRLDLGGRRISHKKQRRSITSQTTNIKQSRLSPQRQK